MIIGFLAGSFDVIHPGYIHMFKEAKDNCNYLVVGLHEDPTKEKAGKLKPILSLEDRLVILSSIKYINDVKIYKTEKDLIDLMINTKPHIRFLGDDYKDKEYTGQELNIPVHFCDRSHGWSTTLFKQKIKQTIT